VQQIQNVERGGTEMTREMLAFVAFVLFLLLVGLILVIELRGYKKQAHDLANKLMNKIVENEEAHRQIYALRERLWRMSMRTQKDEVVDDTTKYEGYDPRD